MSTVAEIVAQLVSGEGVDEDILEYVSSMVEGVVESWSGEEDLLEVATVSLSATLARMTIRCRNYQSCCSATVPPKRRRRQPTHAKQ